MSPWSVLSSHSIHSDTEYNSCLILQGPDHSTSSRKMLLLWGPSPLQSAIFTGVDASFVSFLCFSHIPGTC